MIILPVNLYLKDSDEWTAKKQQQPFSFVPWDEYIRFASTAIRNETANLGGENMANPDGENMANPAAKAIEAWAASKCLFQCSVLHQIMKILFPLIHNPLALSLNTVDHFQFHKCIPQTLNLLLQL